MPEVFWMLMGSSVSSWAVDERLAVGKAGTVAPALAPIVSPSSAVGDFPGE
jgi:hypothetical protein